MKPIRIILLMTASAAVVTLGLLMTRKNGVTMKTRVKQGAHDWYTELVSLLQEENSEHRRVA